jgi:hypothetical protein
LAKAGLLGGFGASISKRPFHQAGSNALLPCVYTFSKDYDISTPYYPDSSENNSLRLDSTFIPDPPGGWFGFGDTSSFYSYSPIMALDYFQTAPWFRFALSSNITSSEIRSLGSRQKAQGLVNPLGTGVSTTGFSSSPYNGSVLSSISPEGAIAQLVSTAGNSSGWSGLLGNIETNLFLNISDNYSEFINPDGTINYTGVGQNSYGYGTGSYNDFSQLGLNLTVIQALPWFAPSNLVTDDEMDDQLTTDLLSTLDLLSTIDTAYGIGLDYGNTYAFPAVAAAIQAVSNMPWGSLRFNKVQNGSYAYLMQLGTDIRLLNIASYPAEGLRRIASQTMIAKAARTSLYFLH